MTLTACVGFILETVRCRKLILGRDISWGRGVQSGLDLTFDLALVNAEFFSYCLLLFLLISTNIQMESRIHIILLTLVW